MATSAQRAAEGLWLMRLLLATAEGNRWAMIPPNQDTADWMIFRRFDGEFGYQDEIGSGPTLIDAISMAMKHESA